MGWMIDYKEKVGARGVGGGGGGTGTRRIGGMGTGAARL
jgi:hypothetical protein